MLELSLVPVFRACVHRCTHWSDSECVANIVKGPSQQLGRTGRTDCGIHNTMMSRGQYVSQVRSADLAQLEESDISPMILRSLVAGRSSLLVSTASIGANTCKREDVPAWNPRHKGSDKDRARYCLFGLTL